ncbi:MAG: transketolase [Humidesulfovibrio sp.]|uniref:transketolase n=1 Tax=Humidesulfovibrio sp. TaxID=2910988 RepID=UPI0027F9BE6E|nr:transketolase [Humidesulfovibrio sp.]MDQ7834822.1 transketolase [Humidesulfovibrio sp.]
MPTFDMPTTTPQASVPLDDRSRQLRREILLTLKKAGRGHLAPALSLVEIMRVLYDHVLRFDPARPDWAERDRSILSKGHGCLALYALLADKGFFPASELDCFCKPTAMLGGHPEHCKVPGVEASTGSLGHGLPIGVGRALAARLNGAPWRTFVIMGDGECNEGSVWEAAMAAGKHKLSSLTAIVDYNKQQSYATTAEVLDLEPFAAKWETFGFSAIEVDGHDVEALKAVFARLPLQDERPTAIICHTVKGRGFKSVERNLAWHHKTKLSDEEYEKLLAELEGV